MDQIQLNSFEDYREAIYPLTFKNGQRIPYEVCLLGLVGEAGEVCDLLKKALWHGRELPREELIKELGDVLWYLDTALSLQRITYREVLGSRSSRTSLFSDKYTEFTVAAPGEALNLARCAAELASCAYALTAERGTRTLISLHFLAASVDASLKDVAEANVRKLRARYPNGMVEGGGIR